MYLHVAGSSRLVAEFYLDPGYQPGTPVPPPGFLALKYALYDDGLSVSQDNRDTAETEGHFNLSVVYPDGPGDRGALSKSSSLRDPRGRTKYPDMNRYYTSDYRIYSYLPRALEIYCRPPDDETYRFLVYSKREDRSSRRVIAEILLDGAAYADAAFPPSNRIFFCRQFVDEGFRLLRSNIAGTADGEVYEMVVQAPEGTGGHGRFGFPRRTPGGTRHGSIGGKTVTIRCEATSP